MLITSTNKLCTERISDYFINHAVVDISYQAKNFDCDWDIIICDAENYEVQEKCAIVFIVLKSSEKITLYADNVQYLFEPFNPVIIELELFKLLNTKRSNLRDVLKELGMPSHLIGYKFLKEAICIYRETNNLSKAYEVISKKYGCKACNVERQIRYAIEKSWLNANIKLVDELFGYAIDFEKAKPTNKQYIDRLKEFL